MKQHRQTNAGIGVGYVTVIIIFAIICLTIFAVLSYRAAGSNDALNERAGEHLNKYYEADASAKKTLYELDEIAANARNTPFFADTFESETAKIDKVSVKTEPDGCTVSFSEPINENSFIFVSVKFYENKKEYKINTWKRMSAINSDDNEINVWDGTF